MSSSTPPRAAKKTRTFAAIRASRSPLSIPKTLTAISRFRGRVVEITEEGADDSINKLAKKYLGVDKYPYGQPGEVRVVYKIKPEHTTVMG